MLRVTGRRHVASVAKGRGREVDVPVLRLEGMEKNTVWIREELRIWIQKNKKNKKKIV